MQAENNPFRSSAVAKLRYRIARDERNAMLARIGGDTALLGSIVGPEGTGKTTLLEDLANDLRRQERTVHWLQLNRDTPRAEREALLRRLDTLEPRSVACLDGGEVLGPWQWLRLRRTVRIRGYSLIATLHHPRNLPILHHTRPDWPTVRDLLHDLLGPTLPPALEHTAHAAFISHHGNVREVFRACYWSCARGG